MSVIVFAVAATMRAMGLVDADADADVLEGLFEGLSLEGLLEGL